MRERARHMHYSFSTEKGVPLLERSARLFLYREVLQHEPAADANG